MIYYVDGYLDSLVYRDFFCYVVVKNILVYVYYLLVLMEYGVIKDYENLWWFYGWCED